MAFEFCWMIRFADLASPCVKILANIMKTKQEIADVAIKFHDYLRVHKSDQGTSSNNIIEQRLMALMWVLESKTKEDPSKPIIKDIMPDETFLKLHSCFF